MSNAITSTGLVTDDLPTIVTDLTTGLQGIYGAAINVDQNAPDGQFINIFAQAIIDKLELIAAVYASFDPDRASGSVLDERVTINNIVRGGGTYTIQLIDITVSQTVTLPGLDGNFNNVNGTGYTVQDDAGNQFILVDTTTLTAGVTTLEFRAALLGTVQTVIGTITNFVTVVLGVTSINNSVVASTVGQNQETDAELRIRRQNSVAIAAQGYLNGLLGAVLAVTGVTEAQLYENNADTATTYGQPAHSMWLIVAGGANTDIANAIYNKKSFGANMYGGVTVPITTPSGLIFNAMFDRPTAINLYIQFNIHKTTGTSFDTTGIENYMQANLLYNISQIAETSSITAVALAAINATSGGGVPIDLKISLDGITYVDYLTVPNLAQQFVVSPSNISITVL
jgi:hypothetical protein